MPIEVWFCDQSTTHGFIFATCVQMLIAQQLVMFSLEYTGSFITHIFGYDTQVNLLAEDFKNLDKMWTDEKNASGVATKHAFLLNICKKRQDMIKLVFL